MNEHQHTHDLAIIIVSWNTRKMTLDCLQSVYADATGTDANIEVVVVDNGSSDGTPDSIREMFPQVMLIEPGENLGFARGNNAALHATGFPRPGDAFDYVLLLNPDTVVKPGALQALLEGIEATGAGLVGARLVYGDGRFQHSAFGFPGLLQVLFDLYPVPGRLLESSLNGRYPLALYTGDKPFAVDFPLGATFFLRGEVIRQTGLFDERFFMYCEEIDWAKRIHAAGWPVYCIPTAEVVHYGGQSTKQVKPDAIRNLWKARLQLYDKHYSAVMRGLARVIIRAGMNRAIRQTMRDSTLTEDVALAVTDAYKEVIGMTRQTWGDS